MKVRAREHFFTVAAECVRDRLYQRRATPRALLEIVGAMAEARAAATRVTLPLLVLGGEDDPVVAPVSLSDFVRRAGSSDKRAILYPGFYHEVFNETERERPLADLTDWLEERSR